ncbi:hypothetical protein KY290_020982 [Solanum tuberosum]|uniref:Uncharacterized protein n=1 Tax=Solanum tuberosum TaxID=4113 RepID=A0ABQ7V094_SOLTU|nr:hypothetical protein KY289_020168 [Solanum tuberosum]KAH0757489.1 hypothetical protein KY290_020982 [Solanum tuberosum]
MEKPTSLVQEQLPQSSVQLQQPQSLDGQTNPSMQLVQGPMEGYVTKLSPTSNIIVWIIHYYFYFIFVKKSHV